MNNILFLIMWITAVIFTMVNFAMNGISKISILTYIIKCTILFIILNVYLITITMAIK